MKKPLPRFFLLAAVSLACALAHAQAGKVLRMAPHSNLTILDPIWTTAYISRNHGYMIYDTLFATDSRGQIKPQMVDKHSVSADRKTYSFTLRDGLQFHDGTPVTSSDVIASLARWGKRDAMGQDLMRFIDKMEAVDAKTFRIILKETYGLVLEALGKPSSNVPFIMPKRVADTPADKQIDDYVGSGPFVFAKDEWKPGEKVVYLKNASYKPRYEAPSGTAGGKIAKVDRVEWLIIKDPQTQVNALAAGEIDLLESVPFELFNSVKKNPDIQLINYNPAGFQAIIRFNHLHPPFNNPKVRQAAIAAMNQLVIMRTQVGVSALFRTCASFYPCSSRYHSTRATEMLITPNMKHAQQLLKQSGYDGTPVVLMQPTDLAVIAKLPVAAAQLLRQAGFKVDLQATDWQTLVSRRAKKEPPAQGGWNAFLTVWAAADADNPAVNYPLNASCDKAWFGWPCDAEMEKLRDRFARAATDAERRTLAAQIQARAMEIGTHAPVGEYTLQMGARRNISGVLSSPALVLWNISKN